MIEQRLKIIIAAGGTGGHVFPGIAIAESLKKMSDRVDVVFAGTSGGPEVELVAKGGWPIVIIGRKSVHRGGFLRCLLTYLRVPRFFVRAWKVINRERPDMVIGIGGFAAGPLLLAASLRGLATAVVEPNAIAGRANKLLSPFVKKVFVGFPSAASSFPSKRTTVTGNPVRQKIASLSRAKYDGQGAMTILCFGGSQGAKRLNEVMMEVAEKLKEHCDQIRFLHQVGKANSVEEVAVVYRDAGFEAEVFEFSHCMEDLYREADLALTRAGAGTIAELAAVRLPSILVPYPYAVDDHQRANAEELMKVGGAVVIDESKLDADDLAARIKSLLKDPPKLAGMFDALREIGRPDAADRIAADCLKMLE